MKIIRLKLSILMLLFISASGLAQTQKLSKDYKISNDVIVEVDSKYTDIIIENWGKNELKINAYLDGNVEDTETVNATLENWKVNAARDGNRIKIQSSGKGGMEMDLNMAELEEALSALPEMLEPIMNDLVAPLLSNMTDNPLPSDFAEDLKGMKFDYEAYKKDGDKYLNKWEAKFEKKFGKDFDEKMEKWAQKFEEKSAKWEEENEEKMEAWGEKFEQDMEAWGEEFGKKMEIWGENFGKQFEAQMASSEKPSVFLAKSGSKLKKTIKIKVPEDVKLQLKVRHGNLNIENAQNLQVNLSHGKFTAKHLSGKNTKLKIAYSPVEINSWKYGVLETEFVENCKLGTVESIKLDSNTSNVMIEELEKTGVLTGSFGELGINKLGKSFETLSINLENSDLVLNVPDTAFNFSFNGVQSSIKHPGTLKLKSTKSYDNELLNGYQKARDASATITIKANYSDVLIN